MRTRELMVYKDFEDGQLLDNMTFLIEHCQDMSCDKNRDNLITLFYDCIHRLIELAGICGIVIWPIFW